MKTLNDLDLSKEILKKKNIRLYKAFKLKEDDEMIINPAVDVLSLSHEAAIQYMINDMSLEEAQGLANETINFAVIVFKTDYLLPLSLLENDDDVYFNNDSLSISIRDKIYKISVEDKVVKEIEVEINPKNEIKSIKNIIIE